jgi:hypothetical protein
MIELPWDPELDSPATLAIIGAGPIGIEAAIYARFLGYFVSIFDSRRVAHRMLDWNDRKLGCPVSDCTSPLGHAAIKSQNPDYVLPNPDAVWSGKEYAEQYLLPLAKTDLLFDDIHFLSPVSSVSRLRTFRDEETDPQTRCEDQFRLVVEGRHRGTWVSRADIVLDCRGAMETTSGMGPGGGLAIDELVHRESFLKHSPLDRKFESKQILGKHIAVVGASDRACLFVQEVLNWLDPSTSSRLTWILPCDAAVHHPYVAHILQQIETAGKSEIQTYNVLGVEKVAKSESDAWVLQLLLEDETTVEFRCDGIVSYPYPRMASGWPELDCQSYSIPRSQEGGPSSSTYSPTNEATSSEATTSRMLSITETGDWSFVTCEPGYYRLQTDGLRWDASGPSWNAGVGIKRGLEQIRQVFSLIVGRETLDLYRVMAENLEEGRV